MTELLWRSVMIIAVNAKWIGAALLSLTLCACGERKPEPTTPQNAPSEPIAESKPDPRPVIVAFGDSLTAGYGVEPGKSYPDDLQRRLDGAGYQYHVVNMGVSGNTTTDGVERLQDVLAAKPVIVILEFGGNDGLRGLPVTTTRANQIQMVETLQKAGIQILLAGMTLPGNYGPDYIRSFEQVYLDLATQYKLPRIPFLLAPLIGHPEMIQSDGIHPTAAGSDLVSALVMNNLTPLLKK